MINPLMGTLKPQGNRPLCSSALTGGLLHLVQREGAWAPSPLLAVPNVTAHPLTASVPTLYYLGL